MDLWATRNQSLQWLETVLSSESQHLVGGYAMIDECINIFDQVGQAEGASLNRRFARVCGLTVAKGRNLLLACHSLMLDALAQESGALLRPLLEAIELLAYFRLDPNRVDQASNGKLPSAGDIGKAINGQFQDLRKHLSEEASHYKFGFYSTFHLLDRQTIRIRATQNQSLDVFRTNLTTLSAFLSFLLIEAVSCLLIVGVDANELADRAENWKDKCKVLFPAPIHNETKEK